MHIILVFLLASASHAALRSLEEICGEPEHFQKKDVSTTEIHETYQNCAQQSSDPGLRETAGTDWQQIEASQTDLRAGYGVICSQLASLESNLKSLSEKPFPDGLDTVEQCNAYKLASSIYHRSHLAILHALTAIEQEHVKMVQAQVNASAAEERDLTGLSSSDANCKKALTSAKARYYGILPKKKNLATRDYLAQPTTRSFYHDELLASEKYLRDKATQLSALEDQETLLRGRSSKCANSKSEDTTQSDQMWSCSYSGNKVVSGQGATEAMARTEAEQSLEVICPGSSPKGSLSAPTYIFYWIQCKIPGVLRCKIISIASGIRG